MNIIPSIFNERQINRTVLGGKEPVPSAEMNVSVILLNKSGSQFRASAIENLVKCGFESIVSFEKNAENYNIEDFSHKFPFVKFIVPLEKATDGELINIGMSEVESDYVFVVRDSLAFESEILKPRIAEKLAEQNIFCVAPRIVSHTVAALPVRFSPAVEKSVFKIEPSAVVANEQPTLYPFDKIGFYDRKKFIQLGGYDYTIVSPHWQNLDLSFRAWLWGEKIQLSTLLSLVYAADIPETNVSADRSYSRFYMKNLLPKFALDHGVIPKSSFLVYLCRSGCGFFESVSQFSAARKWVDKNKYRFKIDAKYLVENWGNL